MTQADIKPGTRVRVTQTIERREGPWETEVVGTLVAAEPRKTGSWYAHAKQDRYWLVRLDLRKDDGEVTSLILDRNTRITVVDQ